MIPTRPDARAPGAPPRSFPSPMSPAPLFGGSAATLRVVLLAGGLAVAGLWWADTTSAAVHGLGPWVTSAGRVTGLFGGYLVLVEVLLLCRLGWFERAVGLERLAAWHRALGTNVVILIMAHVLLTAWGYGLTAHHAVIGELWNVITTYPDMITATAGTVIFLAVAVSSARFARQRLSYEAWYWVHVTTYVAIALTFFHQTSTGADFVGHPFNKLLWTGLYLAVAGCVLIWRVVLPVRKWLVHRMIVEKIVPEADDMVSVWIHGVRLDELGARAGQFFLWRFLTPGHVWSAHPYSVSAVPTRDRLRITVRAVGGHSAALAHLRHGTPVLAEGPFGTFTEQQRTRRAILLIAGGSGISPIRALAEAFTATRTGAAGEVVLLYRVSREANLALRRELDRLAARRGLTVLYLVGSRSELGYDPLGARRLGQLVPDVRGRDVFVCGPEGMAVNTIDALRHLGVPPRQIHTEEFVLR
ncbi:MAG: ferredoxin reductase family protein [Actinomycetota bacterium]|nr:ferredoxin reductase family protein [Actinomycetota bacterium]